MPSAIRIEGLDDCLRCLDKAPENVVKMVNTALRTASRKTAKGIRAKMPFTFGRLVRYKVFKGQITGDTNALVGLFVPAGTLNDMEIVSCFPLFNWIIFPVFGVVAGKYLQRCTDKNRLYRNIFLITLPLTLLYVWVVVKKGFTPFSNGEYYWCRLPDALFFIVLDLLAISIFHFLGKILPGFVKRALSALSFNINTVYCISWILIGWTYAGIFYIMEVPPIGSWIALIPGVALVFVSYWLALGWKKLRNRF